MSFPLLLATTGECRRSEGTVRLLRIGSSTTMADAVSMVSSIISGLQVEDPSQSGVFNKVPTFRNRNYNFMDSQYT